MVMTTTTMMTTVRVGKATGMVAMNLRALTLDRARALVLRLT